MSLFASAYVAPSFLFSNCPIRDSFLFFFATNGSNRKPKVYFVATCNKLQWVETMRQNSGYIVDSLLQKSVFEECNNVCHSL